MGEKGTRRPKLSLKGGIVLRDPAVRFASRFGFTLDESIVHAATDPEVQEALRTKVSRERVGKEVQGMLRGPSPVGLGRKCSKYPSTQF